MILTKLRTDAGVVVGRSKALTDACDRLAELKQQIAEKKKYDAEIRPRLTELSKKHAEITIDIGNLKREQTRLRLTANKIEQKLEEFWENDPGQVKQRYLRCTKALEDFNIDQYFLFRNHRVPPEFTRKVSRGYSYDGWKTSVDISLLKTINTPPSNTADHVLTPILTPLQHTF